MVRECNKTVRGLITSDLRLGSEPTLARSLISIELTHEAVSSAKMCGDDNGDN